MSIPLGVLTRYDEMGASSRLRYYLFRNALENGGFRPEYHPFFRAAYLRRLYAGQGKSRLLAAGALLRRLALLPRRNGCWSNTSCCPSFPPHSS